MGFIKKGLIALLVLIACLYLSLYFVLPYFLNKKNYSKAITDIVKSKTGLVLIIEKYNLRISPNLDLNLKAQEIMLFYPDKKQIADIKNADIEISTAKLLQKELKINRIKAEEFQFSTKLLKTGKTTFQEYLEKNLKQTKDNLKFSQQIPKIQIKKYIIKVKDEESGQRFKLSGKNFKTSQNIDLRYIDINAKGSFYCFNREYVKYDFKIAIPKILFKDFNNKLFDISFDNLYKQNFNAKLTTDIKIHTKENKFDYLSGKINIDNFCIVLGGKKLPPSYFHIVTDKGMASINSEFYTNKEEKTIIEAIAKITKPYELNMKCSCQKADIQNLQKLAISVLEILKIKNNLSEFKTSGTISSDFSIATDLKKIQSNGKLKISNAKFTHKDVPLNISNINAILDFSNNTVNIKQSSLTVNNQPLKIVGIIDSNAFGNIEIKANNLDLNHIMNAFPLLKPNKNVVIKTGKLTFNAKIKGKLTEAKPIIKAQINNFSAQELKNQIQIYFKQSDIDITATAKNFNGKIIFKELFCKNSNNKNTAIVKAPIITANIDDKELRINPSRISTGNANLTLSGTIKNYLQKPETRIIASGTVDSDIVKLFSNNSKIKFYRKGYLPTKIDIKANKSETKIQIQILSNQLNYISPVIVTGFSKTNMLTSILVKVYGDELKIEDFSTYYAPTISNLLKEINTFKLKKAISIKGKIKKFTSTDPIFDNFRIQTAENIKIELPEIKNSTASINTDITLSGNIKKPIVNGYINITELSIPQYFVKAQSLILLLNKNKINAKIDNLKIKNTDISIEAIIPHDVLNSQKINYLKIYAQQIDMNYLMSLMQILPLTQAKYAPGNEFPYIIESGKLYIKSYKMNAIKASDITADISAEKNILNIKNLYANAYGGKVAGHIKYDFPYMTIKAELQGRWMDAGLAARDFLPQQQRMSGKLNFDASISMIGTTMEQQLKTLKGRADILINNGHLGQLGRFEHFLYAQNLLSQRLIYANLNSAKQAISPKDTGYITYLKGMLKFNNGYMYLNPVLTAGPRMSMYMTGNINLLTNDADIQILGKISSEVSSSLGLLGTITIKEFLDEHTKYGAVVANLFNFYNTELPEMDISKIPDLKPNYNYPTKNFRVVIFGNTESIKSVKSFTWINPPGTKQRVLKEKIQETLNKTLPQKNESKDNLPPTQQPQKPQPIIESKPMQTKEQTLPDFLNSIPDKFN